MAKKNNNTPLIVGAVAGGCFLLCLCGGGIGTFIYLGMDADSGSDTYSYGIDVPTAAVPASGLAAAIQLIPDGGSSAWDEAVKVLMLGAYDSNSSGEIDSASEVAGVPCDVWKVTDSAVRSKWTYGVRTIYGFDEGAWIGDALGYAESQRAAADAKAASCGLNDE
ncbi:MAG: hypothetical protein GY898_07395 [Proteobacteria bacterium]|nr:hypothetical protein [Pseudomonadota bacterium]